MTVVNFIIRMLLHEKAEACAIILDNGKIYTGEFHSKAYFAAQDAGEEDIDERIVAQGFIHNGRFITQDEGEELARKGLL